MDLKELSKFTYQEGFREGKEMGKQHPMNDPLPFKRWWQMPKVKAKVKACEGKPDEPSKNSLHKHIVSVCTCPMESTDVYDDDGKYLGYVCLGCGYFSKY